MDREIREVYIDISHKVKSRKNYIIINYSECTLNNFLCILCNMTSASNFPLKTMKNRNLNSKIVRHFDWAMGFNLTQTV